MLINQINNSNPKVENQYNRVVKKEGNLKAQEVIKKVFKPCYDWWRGLGILKQSGLKLNSTYINFDAENKFDINVESKPDPKGCLCGKILKGLNSPYDCPLFSSPCTPVNPIGACMVSSEGACAAFYKYEKKI